MNARSLIESLAQFRDVLPAVVQDVRADDWRWKPPDGAWSILEVVNHLADEEVDDFRKRLSLTLEDPLAMWPPVDPEGWARQRCYNDSAPQEVLERFCAERHNSVEWLGSLKDPDWSTVHEHPKIGPLRAGDLLSAWAAHDYLHLRQISKRLYQMVGRDTGGYSPRYAGQWST